MDPGAVQDLMADEEVEAEPLDAAAPPPSFPAEAFRPGRVVWAKVEGHEWWPAKIVRRRAVPKDVAEPPGGKAFVKYFIPVIFFTARGVPGDIHPSGDRLEAIMAASAHPGTANLPVSCKCTEAGSWIFWIGSKGPPQYLLQFLCCLTLNSGQMAIPVAWHLYVTSLAGLCHRWLA